MIKINEIIAAAIAELKTHEWVIDAIWNKDASQKKPGNYVKMSINLFYRPKGKGATWTTVDLYINLTTFDWEYHYNLPQMDSNIATVSFFEAKLPTIKAAMDLDFIEIDNTNEEKESIILAAIKTDKDNKTNTYIIKAWKTGKTTCDYRIIKKTIVE